MKGVKDALARAAVCNTYGRSQESNYNFELFKWLLYLLQYICTHTHVFLNLGFWRNILRCTSALQALDIITCRKFSLEIRLHVSMLLSLKWPSPTSQNCFCEVGSGKRDTEVRPGMKETWGLHGLVKKIVPVRLGDLQTMDDFLSSLYSDILPLKLSVSWKAKYFSKIHTSARMSLQMGTGIGFLCNRHDLWPSCQPLRQDRGDLWAICRGFKKALGSAGDPEQWTGPWQDSEGVARQFAQAGWAGRV